MNAFALGLCRKTPPPPKKARPKWKSQKQESFTFPRALAKAFVRSGDGNLDMPDDQVFTTGKFQSMKEDL